MITKVIAIILLLLFILQTIFSFALKLEHTRFQLKKVSQIREKDARKFLRRVRRILWILPTKKNRDLVQGIYNNFLDNPNVFLDTQWAIYKKLRKRGITNLSQPADLPYNPFEE